MDTFLIGSPNECRDALEEMLRAQGHEVRLIPDGDTARELYEASRSSLLVLSEPAEDVLAFCRDIRERKDRGVPIVLAVAPSEEEHLQALAEGDAVDELIFDCEKSERLRAQLALAESRVQRRARHTQAREELKRRAEQQAVLARLGRQALNDSPLKVLIEQAAEGVAQAVHVDYAAALRLEEGELIVEVESRKTREETGTESVTEAALAERVLQSSDPVIVQGPGEQEGLDASLLPAEARSGIGVRIAGESAPYGVLVAYSATPRAFTKDDEHFMQAAARVLAGVVGRKRTEQNLRESEAKARAVLETTVDAIITIDEYGYIESFNQAAEEIFGYEADEVMGKNVKVLMPEPYRSEHDSYLRSYRETGQRKIIGIGREVEGRRKDGSTFPMDLAVSEVQFGERRLFTGIVRDISERRRLEREVLEISEEERRSIGRDLHDNLGQMLTGVGLLSQNLARKLRKADAPGAEEAAKIENLIKEADEQVRGLARGLVPVDLEAEGLADALRRLADQTEHIFDGTCTFKEAGTAAVHDSTVATHLYRIAQEAVHNAVKHGKARRIAIMLASGDKRIRLRVKDNGVGFPEEEAAVHESQAGGMGVRTMHHRARMIGASLEIQSTSGEGTSVTCTMRPEAPGCPVH